MPALEDLLDRVAEALLAGDLTALGTLGEQIETTPPVAADRAAAERLQAKALRNARLLEAATRGVRAARRRMSDIVHGPTLTTYDAHGRTSAIAPAALGPARRV